MRKPVLFLLIAIALLMSCEEEKNETYPLECVETTYGGCFQEASVKIYNELQNDTLYFDKDGEALKLVAVVNYNCCGNLVDDYEIINDNVVNIYISDTCVDDCLCHCDCSYVFNYYFSEYENKSIDFNVYFKGYMEDVYILWDSIEYID